MPRCEALEILRVASRRIRSDILPRRRDGEAAEPYLEVRRNKPAPCLTRGRMKETQQMGVFQQPVRLSGSLDNPFACAMGRLGQGQTRFPASGAELKGGI